MPEAQSPIEKVNNPELNRQILSYLSFLSTALDVNTSPLEMRDGEAILQYDKKELARITPTGILLAGSNIEAKIILPDTPELTTTSAGFDAFIKEIEGSIVRLNHVGVSYFCSNLAQEAEEVKDLVAKSGFSIYEEDPGNPHQKWLFAGGNLQDWQQPLFEVVLTPNQEKNYGHWVPHFQIDLDTKLSIGELTTLTDKHFRPGFLEWKLDVDKVGTVLAMGIMDNIEGTKVTLGLGTNKRGTEWHRKYGLSKI